MDNKLFYIHDIFLLTIDETRYIMSIARESLFFDEMQSFIIHDKEVRA